MTSDANNTVYDRARLEFVSSLIPQGRGFALDVGCASGETTAMLASRQYEPLGVDIDPIAIQVASQRYPQWTFRVGSIEAAAGEGPFDLVMALEVIEHIEFSAQEAFVAGLHHSVKPGGLLVLSTPGRWSIYSIYERARWLARRQPGYDWWDPTHIGVISARRLLRLLGSAGFTAVAKGGFHYLPPRLKSPFGTSGPFWRSGFCLVVVARAG